MNQKIIYLDHNATTPIAPEVLTEMLPYLADLYGNPSSSYAFSKPIKKAIQQARNTVAQLLNAQREEIIFTSCATESNNTAINNAIQNNPQKKHLITTQVEHSSVLATMADLEQKGYRVTYLAVDQKGCLDLNELKQAINEDTLLITVMYANNEIGNIYPIAEISKIAQEHNILFHVDAVQAVGKIKIDVQALGIDSLALSGHKINAPKGIGVLYLKQGTPFKPYLFGGHQEQGRRGGTENVAGIIGLGKACALIMNDDYQFNNQLRKLRDSFEEQLKANITGVTIYGDLQNRLTNTSSIAFEGVKGDELLMLLESFNVFVATGSACNSAEAKPSHVLTACHIDLTNSSPIRVSFGKNNTQAEVDLVVKNLINIVNNLRKKNQS